MSSKTTKICKKNPKSLYKSLKFFKNTFKMSRILKKKPRILKKRASQQLPHCHNDQFAPDFYPARQLFQSF
jgi:hypothetical protein